MKAKQVMKRIFDEVLREIENNPSFAERLLGAVGYVDGVPTKPKKSHRREPAKIDPMELLASTGEGALKEKLAELNLEQLKDIVAHFAMDPAKLVMKWRDPARIIEHIAGAAAQRLKKGDAFRGTSINTTDSEGT